MLFYEVKLMHPQTKEIYYSVTSEKAQLPDKETMERYKGAILVIRTTSTPSPQLKKVS
jgi:hypothetical protein